MQHIYNIYIEQAPFCNIFVSYTMHNIFHIVLCFKMPHSVQCAEYHPLADCCTYPILRFRVLVGKAAGFFQFFLNLGAVKHSVKSGNLKARK